MITGLPPYRAPIFERVRCVCRRLYFVYTGLVEVKPGEGKFQADQISARYVDARQEPFVNCECGQVLDFAPETSKWVQ